MHMRAFLCAEHRTLAPGKRRRQSLELKKQTFTNNNRKKNGDVTIAVFRSTELNQ